jgi:hypothetical protein
MMFGRFTADARAVVKDALEEAREGGARSVEAAERGTVARALALSGVDRDDLARSVGEAIAGR